MIAKVALAVGVLVAGCPIPWRDTMVVQPALEVAVRDESGAAIEGAKVLVVAGTNPHHRLEGTEEQVTDFWGYASFAERSETKTIYPLMMHGVPFYYWEWCVAAEGFAAQTGELGGEPVEPALEVVLVRADAPTFCAFDGGRATIRGDAQAPEEKASEPESSRANAVEQ